MSTPDPRTERAQLDKWLLQTNRYPGTVTAGEAAQHLYDAAAKANDAITTEAARHQGRWTREYPTQPGWYWYRDRRTDKGTMRPLEYFKSDIADLHKWGNEYGEWCPIARPE